MATDKEKYVEGFPHTRVEGDLLVSNDVSMEIEPLEKTTNPYWYSRYEIEPWDFIIRNKIRGGISDIIEYVCRYDAKNGVQDLKKARAWLDKLIEEEEKGG